MIVDGIHYFSRKEIQFMYVNRCLICYTDGKKHIIHEGENGLTWECIVETLRFYNSETKKAIKKLQEQENLFSLDESLDADEANMPANVSVMKAYSRKCCEPLTENQILRDIFLFVATLSEQEQWLFDEYFLKQRLQADIAAEKNVSECAISRRISRLKKKISENFEY